VALTRTIVRARGDVIVPKATAVKVRTTVIEEPSAPAA
jgi:hypothetical protein